MTRKFTAKQKLLIAVICVIVLCCLSIVRIDGKFVNRFCSELRIESLNQHDAEKLKFFPQIRELSVSDMQTKDISFVEYMPLLENFSVDNLAEPITDISSLSACRNLEYVCLNGYAELSDLSCFSDAERLRVLWIGQFLIRDIKIHSLNGIESLTPGLKSLALSGVEEKTVSTEQFPQLKYLDYLQIWYSSVEELTFSHNAVRYLNVANNPELKEIHFGNAERLETLDYHDCPELIISKEELMHLPSLKKILISDYQLSEQEIKSLKAYGMEVTVYSEEE